MSKVQLTEKEIENIKLVSAYAGNTLYKYWSQDGNNTTFPHWHMKYSESYDWLMPVVKKVMNELPKHYSDVPFNTDADNVIWEHIDGIKRMLAGCFEDIKPLYHKTVEAIQYLNQIAAINQ